MSPTQPSTLYHYTSWSSFLSIIRSATLRMTHAKFLNDRVEMRHGLEFVSDEMTKLVRRASGPWTKALERIAKDWADGFKDTDAFVLSFCERGDALEQWRGYTPLGGCSIGFSFKELRRAANDKKYWMLPCLYSRLSKSERVSKILKWHENDRHEHSGTAAGLADAVCSDFMVEIPRFKHYAFRSEREWRLFVFDSALDESDELEFTSRVNALVPHLSLPFTKSCIKQVVLSPFSDETSKFGIEWFLDHHGFGHVKVASSRVPLRHG